MIDPILAINKIKNYLKAEIDSGRLNGEYQESTKTVSFYVYKTPGTTEPLLTLRITDHRPYLQKYIRSNAPRPSVEPNTNMSIEFYMTKKDSNGKTMRNRFINKVISPSSIPIVHPFTVSSFNYDSRKLDIGDDDIILKAIMDWIRNSKGERPYSDPFEKTPKEANVITKTANVVIKMVQMNISNGDYGADYVSESKNQKYTNIKTEGRNVVRLTESNLKMIIRECIKKALNESYSVRRLGCFDVVKGDNQPHSIKGLEQYGNALYDVRLYSNVNDKKETFAIFSIGKNTSKYICCRLEFDEEYGTWLGFTPIKNYDVPTMIKQDLKNNPINQ